MKKFLKHIIGFKGVLFIIATSFITTTCAQTLNWFYDYSLSDHSMAIEISENSIDLVTVDGSAFPVGNVIGVFYENLNQEYVCVGSAIWNYQSTVLPVFGSDDGLIDGQQFTIFAFINGSTYPSWA